MKSDILEKFEIGDYVYVLGESANHGDRRILDVTGFITAFKTRLSVIEICWQETKTGKDLRHFASVLEIRKIQKERLCHMNKIIIEMFPATKDAVLIDKHFGRKIDDDPLMKLLIRGKEAELLAEAQRLEEEKKL